MTLKEFVIEVLTLETYAIECESFADMTVFRQGLDIAIKNRHAYTEDQYKEIISNGHQRLQERIGKEIYEQMFVLKLPKVF